MIRLVGVTKSYRTRGVRNLVANNITLTIPSIGGVALIGRNGAGKSTLLKLIAGTMRPTAGRIEVDGSISWPVGFAGSFHGDLTGVQNTRFVARIYGVDTDQLEDFVRHTADLGAHYSLPFRTYSAGMKARLAFAVSMGIDFDTYLIDEVTSVGDAAFRARSEAMLNARLQERAAIVVSHSLPLVKRLCSSAVVLERGHAFWFDDIDEATEAHRRIMTTAKGTA